MDPIQLIIAQYMQQAMPEYSVSKGWQPVDIGTLSQNMNYEQDIMQTLGDPFRGAMSGFIDESAFAPTYEEVELPDEPETPRLATWAQSSNPIQQAILQGISEGLDPRMVVQRLTVPQPDGSPPAIEMPIDESTGKPDTSEFDYYVGEAGALRDELYTKQKWTQQVEQIQAQGPKEIPSELAKQFTEAGFRLPTEQYTPESLSPGLLENEAFAADSKKSYESEASAYEQALKARNQQRGQEKKDSIPGSLGLADDAMYARPKSGGGSGQNSGRVPTQRGRNRTTGAPNMISPQQRGVSDTPHAGAMIGAANVSARQNFAAAVARQLAERQAASLQSAGRTPFLDQIMGRAGV